MNTESSAAVKTSVRQWAGKFASELVRLRDAANKGNAALAEVEEIYGEVAGGIKEFGGHTAGSVHRLVLDLAADYVKRITEAVQFHYEAVPFPSGYHEEEEIDECMDPCMEFVRQDIVPYLEKLAVKLPDEIKELGISLEDYRRLTIWLQQEFFCAWRRKYPHDTTSYETILSNADTLDAVLNTVEENSASQGSSGPKRRRPAYGRDHQWLDWHCNENMGPAKIRDHWDSLSEQQRKDICSTAWETVGGEECAERRAGYEVVKSGLKRARKEHAE